MKQALARIARMAAVALAVVAPACGDTSGGGDNPVPALTSLSPDQAQAGGDNLELAVAGTGFVRGSVVRFNGADLQTRYESGTRLSATVLKSMVASVTTASVTVFNPPPAGGLSNAVPFPVVPRPNPVPAISGLSPAEVDAGTGTEVVVTVNGTGFVPQSVVYLDQKAQFTEYVSPTQIRGRLAASQTLSAGTAQLAVFNPAPAGGTSEPVTVTLRAPVPVIASLGPQQLVAGEPSWELIVNGGGFVANSQVRFNGQARPTTFVSAGQLKAVLNAADLSTVGTYPVTVTSPAPGGGTSNVAALELVNGVPALTELPVRGATAGSGAFTLVVHGAFFVHGSVVRWNGSDRPTTYISPTRVAAAISAADVQTPGTAQVAVFNPAPGGGTSQAATVTIRALATWSTLRGVFLPAQDVAYSKATGRLYISLPGSSPQHANSVAEIDPADGTVTGATFMGSEPGVMGMSDDGSALWVGMDGSASIRRYSPATREAGLDFFSQGGHAEEIEVMPGSPGTIAVSLANPTAAVRHLAVCMWDNGVRRASCLPGLLYLNTIEWGGDAKTLYAYQNEVAPYAEFHTIGVLADGLHDGQASLNLLSGTGVRIHHAAGRVYADNGVVIDAERHVKVGTFAAKAGSVVVPDAALGRIFSLDDVGTLTVFDMNTFAPLGSFLLEGYKNDHLPLRPVRIIRWGTDGLAVSDTHHLFVVRTGFAVP